MGEICGSGGSGSSGGSVDDCAFEYYVGKTRKDICCLGNNFGQFVVDVGGIKGEFSLE